MLENEDILRMTQIERNEACQNENDVTAVVSNHPMCNRAEKNIQFARIFAHLNIPIHI